MGVNIDWSLGKMPNVGNNALAAFEQGRKLGDDIRRRKAIKAFTEQPDAPKTLNALIRADPDLGFRASEYQRKRRADQKDDQFGEAMVGYLGPNGDGMGAGAPRSASPTMPSAAFPGQNALAAFTGQQGRWPAPGEEPQPPQAANALSAYNQPQGSRPSLEQAPQLPDSRQEPDPELAFLGTPQTGRDRAFLRMVRIDPLKALKLRSELRDNFVKTLKDTREVYRFGIERLSQASDEQGYQAVLAELEPMTQAIGGNILDHVPANYPGPDGMRELLAKALDAKDQVSAFMRQADIDDDNERADRNTDSIIADRDARRDIQRRGQDIRSTDARRGQDKRGSGGRGARQAMPTATGPNGEKVQWNGTAWVAVQ